MNLHNALLTCIFLYAIMYVGKIGSDKEAILLGMTKEELLAFRLENLARGRETATPEERSASAKKAAATRAQKRNFHLLAKYMMEAEIPDQDAAKEELEMHGFTQTDYQAAVFWSQLKKAIYNGDTEAAKYVRDTSGYKPTDSMQIGNLDDKPFETLDLSKLSNEELRSLIAKRETAE